MKSSLENPRTYDAYAHGWEVDLAADDQDSCEGCNAAIYWIWIRKKTTGEVKRHPVSEALTTRREHPVCRDGVQIGTLTRVFMSSHYADCPERERFGGTPVKP